MNSIFEKFAKKLSAEIKRELPGFSAQSRMAPLGRKPPSDYLNKNIPAKNSAVLILIYPDVKTFSPKTVLILRPEGGTSHAGQVSFPGGGFEAADRSLAETALREAEEEIGIDKNHVEVLGALTPLYIPVSNYLVHPFIGVMREPPGFRINKGEVSAIIEANIEELIAEGNLSAVSVYVKTQDRNMDVPCYRVNEKVIWGATAMIISELAEVIRRIG